MVKNRFGGLKPSLEEQRRRQLIRAVVECVSEEGFDKTTMRKVAQRAGVSTGMLVYYFRNKRELVTAAMLNAFRHSAARIDENTSSTFGPKRLRVLLEQYFTDPDPELQSKSFMLQIRAAALSEPELRTQLLESMQSSRSKLERSVTAGIAAGDFRDDIEPKLAADLVFGLMMGWASEMALFPEALSQEEAVQLSALVLRLLEKQTSSIADSASHKRTKHQSPRNTVEKIEHALLSDQSLPPGKARALAAAFAKMYELVSADG